MTESNYWASLEFRVCEEFAAMPQNALRFRWCDGFVPQQYQLEDSPPSISGWVWICDGQKQEKWNFTLWLPHSINSRSEMNWALLLPPTEVSDWVAVDLARKHIEVDLQHPC